MGVPYFTKVWYDSGGSNFLSQVSNCYCLQFSPIYLNCFQWKPFLFSQMWLCLLTNFLFVCTDNFDKIRSAKFLLTPDQCLLSLTKKRKKQLSFSGKMQIFFLQKINKQGSWFFCFWLLDSKTKINGMNQTIILAVKKPQFLVHCKQIFDPSYFIVALNS